MTNSNTKRVEIRWFLPAFFLLLVINSCHEQADSKGKQANTAVIAPELTKANNNNFSANSTTKIDSRVLSIFQDRNDNYWFGTNAGVYRYDGNNLIVFTTKDGLFQDQVQDIQEDESGNIWFATGGYGVNRFDGQHISTFKVKDTAQQKGSSGNTWKIEQGDLWFYAGGGAFRMYKDSVSYLPFPKPTNDPKYTPNPPYNFSTYGVYTTLKDSKDNLWFGTQAKGVCRYDGKTFTWFTDLGLRGPAVLALFEDKKGKLWFGNNGTGLFCYDGKTLTNITAAKGLSNPEFIKSNKSGPGTLARVWALNEDNFGNLWIGTGDAGVWRYDGKDLINYTSKEGLPNSGIETIYKDKSGNLWFGTNGDGVYKFDGSSFTKLAIN